MTAPPDDGFEWLHEVERRHWRRRPPDQPTDYATRQELIHGPTPWWRRLWAGLRRWYDGLGRWD